MNIHEKSEELLNVLHDAQEKLLRAKRHKFKKSLAWRRENIPSAPGIYALFEPGNRLMYIGETGNLRDRMSELNRTVNHSFRKQLGHKKFKGIKSKQKFSDDIELLLDKFFDEELHVAFIEVYFGRLEIEEFIITNHQDYLINTSKKRKIQNVMNYLKDSR